MILFLYHLIMRIIKKETDYALRALFFIKEKGGKIPVSEIYSQIKAPKPFLRKIFRMMASFGILISQKGKKGGFELKKPFEEITLADINDIFDERTPTGGCPFKSKICANHRTCVLKGKISAIEEETHKRLRNTYIKDLWR